MLYPIGNPYIYLAASRSPLYIRSSILSTGPMIPPINSGMNSKGNLGMISIAMLRCCDVAISSISDRNIATFNSLDCLKRYLLNIYPVQPYLFLTTPFPAYRTCSPKVPPP